MTTSAFSQMLSGYTLTTAEILYRMPDHPSLLQTYLWQEYDLLPKLPRLTEFLDFWQTNLDGKLFKVTVASKSLVSPTELPIIDGEFRLH